MSRILRTVAPAKVNLCLLLGPIREQDGRHELITVFQALSLSDVVEMNLDPDPPLGRDVVECDPSVEGENLAAGAIRSFRAATGWDGPRVRVRIVKRIPIAGGMAGGSSDAAATLRLLATQAAADGVVLPPESLRRIAASLGADVPALVEPGRWLGTGAGERLERMTDPEYDRFRALIVTDPVGLSTPDVFREADRLGLPRTRAALRAALGDVRFHAADLPHELCINELEPAALSLRPDLHDTLDAMRDTRADVVMVSGSGPTCVAFFRRGRGEEEFGRAWRALRRRFGDDRVHAASRHAGSARLVERVHEDEA